MKQKTFINNLYSSSLYSSSPIVTRYNTRFLHLKINISLQHKLRTHFGAFCTNRLLLDIP